MYFNRTFFNQLNNLCRVCLLLPKKLLNDQVFLSCSLMLIELLAGLLQIRKRSLKPLCSYLLHRCRSLHTERIPLNCGECRAQNRLWSIAVYPVYWWLDMVGWRGCPRWQSDLVVQWRIAAQMVSLLAQPLTNTAHSWWSIDLSIQCLASPNFWNKEKFLKKRALHTSKLMHCTYNYK